MTDSGTDRQKLQISNLAHAKILRHVIQYSSGTIHGILVGKVSGDDVQIEDSIPICHSCPSKPLLDMAFRLVQTHLENDSGTLEVVGW